MNQHKNLRYGLAALMVLAVFAVGILGTLLGGAGIYQRLTWRDQTAFNSRTCAQYIATRVRQASGMVEVACFGGVDALVIPESIQGETYLTRVYCYDGWLMELFAAESGSFEPQDGEKLLPAQALALMLEDGLLKASVTDSSGQTQDIFLSLPGQEETP